MPVKWTQNAVRLARRPWRYAAPGKWIRRQAFSAAALCVCALTSVALAAPPAPDAPVIEADPEQGNLSQKQMFGGTVERNPRKEELPAQLNGVGVEEKLKAQVPLDLRFTNSAGKSVALGDLLDGDKPVILTLNYSNCPMLCSIMLNGFVEGLGKMQWSVGEEFELITVSLDPDETPERALSTKERYLSDYGRKGAESGWHFLVGAENDVRTLADTVGFGYRYSEERKEYLHAAAAIVLTPKGEVSRYLYGITYSPKTMRLSLAEASDGKFASTIDQLILFCFHYDATVGRYAPVARNIMTLGGALTVLLLGLFLGGFWVKEARRSQI